MKRILIIVIALVVVLGGIFLFKNRTIAPSNDDLKDVSSESVIPTVATSTPETTSGAENSDVKTFTITGSNYKYDLSSISVNKGDTVKIHFVNSTGFHDLVVEGYDVATPRIQGGQSADITFVADKSGTFEYYCSVGEHRKMGMKGTLVVK